MINREHKDRLFTFIFGREENKNWTLQLYNAVNGSNYENDDDIELTTIEDAVYMGMKNDLSFLFQWQMNVYEQQSTYNPNMPVRELMYVGKLYDKYIHLHGLNIYGKELIKLPVPKLVVFYNGEDEKEDDTVLHLSDSFPEGFTESQSDLSVRVRMLNINVGKNKEIMENCRPLSEYSWLIEQIRKNGKKMEIEAAVDHAINQMPSDYVIRNFLIGHRAEVRNMCITEYNEAETMQMFKEEGRKEGREEGQIIIIRNMLQSGMAPEDVAKVSGITINKVTEIQKNI